VLSFDTLWQIESVNSSSFDLMKVQIERLPPARRIVYVHGTTGSFKGNDFPVLLNPLRNRYPVSVYEYYEDKANATSATDFSCQPQTQRPIPAFSPAAFTFTVDPPDPAPGVCDSNDDLELNAIVLESDLRALAAQSSHITIISNSGGSAIVRAYLAYAAATGSPSLDVVDSVVFLEGVQAGTTIAARYNGTGLPQKRGNKWNLTDQAFDLVKIGLVHDPRRPVFQDVLPRSDFQRYVGRDVPLPDKVHYINLSGDVVLHVYQLPVLPWMKPIDLGSEGFGDFVMLPGSDDPTRLPADGGSRLLPSVLGRGASSTQWILRKEYPVYIDGAVGNPGSTILAGLVTAFNDPASHLFFSRMSEICVQVPGDDPAHPKVRRLPGPIIDAIAALDQTPPDPQKVGFGNMQRVECP
jgi:hypothetical protein